jgi:hypothetical protein
VSPRVAVVVVAAVAAARPQVAPLAAVTAVLDQDPSRKKK